MSPNGGWGTSISNGTSGADARAVNSSVTYTNSWSGTNGITTTSQGTTGNAHNHGITMQIQYIDLIIASKN